MTVRFFSCMYFALGFVCAAALSGWLRGTFYGVLAACLLFTCGYVQER